MYEWLSLFNSQDLAALSPLRGVTRVGMCHQYKVVIEMEMALLVLILKTNTENIPLCVEYYR